MFEPITLRNKLGMEMTINNPELMKPELIKAFMDGLMWQISPKETLVRLILEMKETRREA